MDPNDKPQDVEAMPSDQESQPQPVEQAPVEEITQPAPDPVLVEEQPQTVEDDLSPSFGNDEYVAPPSDSMDGPPPEAPASKTRMFVIIGAAILILGIIAFIIMQFLRSGKGNGGSDAELVYWGLWEEEEVMQGVISEYENNNPGVKIAYEMHSPTQYRERLEAAIERGEGPDIYRFHNTWVPMLSEELAPFPESIISVEQFTADYYPVAQNDLVVEGQVVGVPLMIDGLMLLYNKDILAESNITVPNTWQEFELAANQATVKNGDGSIVTAGAALGAAENVEHFSDILGLILYQNGGNFSNLSSTESVEGMSYYTLFAMEPTNVWGEDLNNSIVEFAQGNVAFIFAPSWQVFTIQEMNPDLNFGTARVPQLQGGTPVAWASYWVEGVSSSSQNKQEAFRFLSYLSSDEVATKLFTEAQKTRPFGSAYAKTSLAVTLSDHEYLGAIIDQAPIMRSWYMASRTKDNGINDLNIKYFKDAVNAVLSGSSPAGAMSTVASGVSEVLAGYGIK